MFVDFDNVYSGLLSLDDKAAELFATDPASWMTAITDGDGKGAGRRFLVRNCYLNPSKFSKYRSHWTRAGFRVIDCPSLTQQGKSSTDINLVLDAVDVLADPVGVDEFFIASADADFTSLVQRIRAADRETTVVVAGGVASAYRSMADHVVEPDDLIELIRAAAVMGKPAATKASYAATPVTLTPQVSSAPAVAPAAAPIEVPGDARAAVRAHLLAAAGPVILGFLAHRARMADPRLTRDWGEFGSFRKWLEADSEGIGTSSATSPGYAWDAARFTAADIAPAAPQSAATASDAMRDQVARVTDIPRLTTAQYAAVLRGIADDLMSHPFSRTEAAKRVRDACAAANEPVSRAAVTIVFTGLLYAGVLMETSSTARVIAEGWTKNALALIRGARMEFDEGELQQLRTWVSGGLLGA